MDKLIPIDKKLQAKYPKEYKMVYKKLGYAITYMEQLILWSVLENPNDPSAWGEGYNEQRWAYKFAGWLGYLKDEE